MERDKLILNFRWSAFARSLALCAFTLTLSVQGPCGASLAAASAEADWKPYYAKGIESLSDQKPVEAEGFFRKALDLTQNDSDAADSCLAKLAETLALRNKPLEAQSIYRRMLDILTRKYGASSKRLVPVLMDLGSIQESLGDHTTAMIFYQRALKINQRAIGPYSPEFAESLHSLGRANARLGKKKEAAKQYRQAVSILMKEPSLKASQELQSVMRDYTDLVQKNDDSDKSLINDFRDDILNQGDKPAVQTIPSKPGRAAESTSAPQSRATDSGSNPIASQPVTSISLPRVNAAPPQDSRESTASTTGSGSAWQNQTAIQLNTTREAQSNSDPQIALRGIEQPWSSSSLSPAYKVLNDSIVDRNRYDQGEEYYKRMIATDLDSLGAHHPSVANDLNGLGQFYIRRQEYQQAEPLLTRAFSIYQETYGMSNLLTINTCAALALVEFHLNKIDKATELYRSALSHSQAALGPNNIETASILNELAYVYFHQGKLQESRTMYGWALSSTEAAVGQQSPMLAACLKDYAVVLRRLGQTSEASNLESRAAGILDDRPHL